MLPSLLSNIGMRSNLRLYSLLQLAQRSVGSKGQKNHLFRWLMSLGALGLFFVAFVDSSVIPLPLPGSTDLLLLLLVSHRGSTFLYAVWLAASASTGSLLGGYLTWSAGRKGGEVALERYVPQRFLHRIAKWIERHGFWSIAIAAILPPPIPLTPFVVAAGALKVTRAHFLTAFCIARCFRYGLLAWLGFTYGRHIVQLWQHALSGWGAIILWSYFGLLVAAIAFGIWKFRHSTRRTAGQPA